MAQESGDDYATARASIRDTVKWASASLLALAAAVTGGLSFAILPDLDGRAFWIAVAVGTAVILVVLLATRLLFSLFLARPVAQSEVFADSRRLDAMAAYRTDLLPWDVPSYDSLKRKLEEARAAGREDEFIRLRSAAERVTSFAATLDLLSRARRVFGWLIAAFLAAVVGIANLVHLHGMAKAGGPTVPVTLGPEAPWSDVARALSEACDPGAGPLTGSARLGQPFEGWATVTLTGPPCPGLIVSVPAALLLEVAP